MYGDGGDKLNYGPDANAPAVRSTGGHIQFPAISDQPQAPIPPGANLIGPGLPGPGYNAPPPGGTMASAAMPDARWQAVGAQQGAWSPNLPAPGGTAGSAPVSQLARPLSGYGDPQGQPYATPGISYAGVPASQPLYYGAPSPGERWEGGGGFQFLMLPDQRIQVVVSPPGKQVGQYHAQGSAGWSAIVAEYDRLKGSGQLRSQPGAAPRQNVFQQIVQAAPMVAAALSAQPQFQPSAASYTPPPVPAEPPPPPESGGVPTAVMIAGGVAALAAFGGLLWWMSGSGEDRKKNPPAAADDAAPAPEEE